MAQKAYNNNINENEVSIAIERLLIANYPNTSFSSSPARISIDSLPSGFYDLGAVVEDTPSFKVTRAMFSLDTGIPQITQYQAVTGLSGTFEAQLHSASWRKVQFALGNYGSSATSTTFIGTISSVINRNAIIIKSTVASWPVDGLAANRQFTIANSGSQQNVDVAESWVGSISTVASGEYILYLGSTPVRSPSLNQNIYTYSYARQYLGSAKILNYALIGVADFIDDQQVVHYMSKVQPMGEFTEEFRPSQNQRTPLSFKAFGYTVTAPDGTEQLIVAERYQFPKV